MSGAFDPTAVYLDLREDGDAREIPLDPSFWPDLMSGNLKIDGRLVSAFRVTQDMDGWERHLDGDELLCLLDGELAVVVEVDGGTEKIQLDVERRCCVVPRGAWHRFTVEADAVILFVTPGKETEHRALDDGSHRSSE